MSIQQAYYAAGCFWGVEYYFQQEAGVLSAISGYMGGVTPNPSYKEVCTGLTGHLEVVKVEYDNTSITFEDLSKLFFEIHDFTQTNGQGPDIGSQYLSAAFYNNEEEKNILKTLVEQLKAKGYNVATSVMSTHNTPFFQAEEYHQDYYFKTGKTPYCHSRRRIF